MAHEVSNSLENREPTRGNQQSICVVVHAYDELRESLGQAHLEVELPAGGHVEDLLRYMARKYDERFLDICIQVQRERSISVIILNGRLLALPEGLQQELRSGDELYLVPPIAGG